jgi:hypothetical protein
VHDRKAAVEREMAVSATSTARKRVNCTMPRLLAALADLKLAPVQHPGDQEFSVVTARARDAISTRR